MTEPNSSRPYFRTRAESGYALLVLMLALALMVMAAAAVAPLIAFQIKRDREAELIHRAAQYRRAVRRMTKQTGRYPITLDDLENTNGLRFLRRRYKDPITGREFRLLHLGDITTAVTGANQNPLGNGAAGDASSPTQQDSTATPGAQNPQSPPAGATPGTPAAPGSPSTNQSGNQPTGGGLIVGVVSTSKKKTIREFNGKSHYNEWLFFYDPSYDLPYEVKGPTPLTRPPASLQGLQGSPGSSPGQPAAQPQAPPQQQPSSQQP